MTTKILPNSTAATYTCNRSGVPLVNPGVQGAHHGIGALNATNLAGAHDTPSSTVAMTEPACGSGA
jgi:hypothetical protein